MTTTYYALDAQSEIVAVRTGMPEQPVRIGVGMTPREALADLQATGMQSAGRDPAANALAWARNNGWLDIDPEELTLLTVTKADMNDRASAWLD